MVYEVLMARSTADAPDPLWPNPGGGKNSFVPESADGSVRNATSFGVLAEVKKGGVERQTGKADKLEGVVTITDSRVVFACTHFQNAGGWRGYGAGGMVAAGLINLATNAAAHSKTKGFTLVGHVRHEWLRAVTAQPFKWGGKQAALRLIYSDPTDPSALGTLTIALNKREPAVSLGEDIVRRACKSLGAAAPSKKTELEDFGRALPYKDQGNGRRSWLLPIKTSDLAVPQTGDQSA